MGYTYTKCPPDTQTFINVKLNAYTEMVGSNSSKIWTDLFYFKRNWKHLRILCPLIESKFQSLLHTTLTRLNAIAKMELIYQPLNALKRWKFYWLRSLWHAVFMQHIWMGFLKMPWQVIFTILHIGLRQQATFKS